MSNGSTEETDAEKIARYVSLAPVKKVRATLSRDGHPFAIGQAAVSRLEGVSHYDVTFYPMPLQHLDTVLNGEVNLTSLESDLSILLRQTRELWELGDDQMWYFEGL